VETDKNAQRPSDGSGFVPPATAQYAPYEGTEASTQPFNDTSEVASSTPTDKSSAQKLINAVVLIACIMLPVTVFFLFTYNHNQAVREYAFKPALSDETKPPYIEPIDQTIPEIGDFTQGDNGYDVNTGVAVDYYEAQWKMGLSNEPLPQSFNQVNDFTEGYETPEDWLASQGITDMKVVYTADPHENCGAEGTDFTKNTDALVLGCYKYEYGKTLLIWWGPDADDSLKKLVLLHEYSHFVQTWSHYDVSISAIMDGRGQNENDEFYKLRETDATCRVFYEWNYSDLEYYNNMLSSSCNIDNWTPEWYQQETEKLGVVIADW
jgi:hypothetical protein